MTLGDKKVSAIVLLCLILAALTPDFMETFKYYSKTHGFIMSFIKFAVLATFGECLALRIVTGKYWRPGFGLCAKMAVWGVLGVVIKLAFIVFATGAPNILAAL